VIVPPPQPGTVPAKWDLTASPVRSVLRHLDPDALRPATRQESRARQRHLPPISVYRWWARRTETVTGAIIDAISTDTRGRLLIADAFAGGGVIALAALLRGHRVYAQDINPWAARSLTTMLSLPPAEELAAAGDRLHALVEDLLQDAYTTTFTDGTPATIAHTLRVATAPCPRCARTLRLFPTGVVSLLTRVDCGGTTGYVACPAGHLTLASAEKRTSCGTCGRYVKPAARYTAGRTARCVDCRWTGKLSDVAGHTGFEWDVVLVERTGGGRREIGPPTDAELAAASTDRWTPCRTLPAVEVGDETAVLRRHGMAHWHDLYPTRQRMVLETLLDACGSAAAGDERVERALEAAVIGSTEMAGFTSRWDARYLKAYEAVANHRFNFTTFAAEPNVWGAAESGRGTVNRRLEHLAKAALWLDEHVGRPLTIIGPKPATARRSLIGASIDAQVVAGSSQRLCVPAGTIDAVVTDPPYHDDVHYGELSDLFRAWAGESTGALDGDAIVRRLNGNGDDTDAYQSLLTNVFDEIRRALRPGGHLILSYANRHPRAWIALFNALQAAGYRAVGYTVVHSENEADHAKSGRRACALDVLIDLVPTPEGVIEPHQPRATPTGEEWEICGLVGSFALGIGRLAPDWADAFVKEFSGAAFIRQRSCG
jgi:putative DNA methylase